MRKEYDIKELNPRKNPYAKELKEQFEVNLKQPNEETIDVMTEIETMN